MRAILEFQLPEEQDELDLARDGSKWFTVVHDLEELIKSRLKHEDLSLEKTRGLNEVRSALYEIIRDLNLKW